MKKFAAFSVLFFIIFNYSIFSQIIFVPYFTAYGTDIKTTNMRVSGGTDGNYCHQFSLTGNSEPNGLGANVIDVEYRLSGFGLISGVALLCDLRLGDIPIMPNGTLTIGLMYNGRQITSKTIDSLSENEWKTISVPFGGTIDEVSFIISGNDTTAPFFGSVVFQIDNMLIQKDINGTLEQLTSFEDGDPPTDVQEKIVPTEFMLYQNCPNPFNPTTTIQFSLPQLTPVSLVVYDILGREVRVLADYKFFDAGTHTMEFNGSSLASGTYIYVLRAGDQKIIKKMLLMK